MRKNNKGFTLVEILASMVILGILAVFALPNIVNMINNSRNKMYITDAKKLIAQAEYKMKSNSSQIEKPDPGDAIAISMTYLDSPDFDTPPNDGEYIRSSSFVIIKNNSGKMEYSASIVEKMKQGGYKGLDLTLDSVLQTRSAYRRIRVFDKDELINVDNLDKNDYVNEQLGSDASPYINSVSNIYNYPDIVDESIVDVETASPKIVSATMSSASGADYGSLKAILRVKADDSDTARKDLTVYYSLDGFEYEKSEKYGDNTTFSKEFDFTGTYTYDGTRINIYVIVSDLEGNESRKKVEYAFHKNLPPVIGINDSSVTKRDLDKENMVTASLRLSVTDDIDPVNDLKVCFADYVRADDPDENKAVYDSITCDNYTTYGEFFKGAESVDYTFTHCSTDRNTLGCQQNGSFVGIKAFVMDSSGAVVDYDITGDGYTIYANKPPSIKAITINSENETFLSGGKKSLRARVALAIEDDLSTSDSDIEVTLQEGSRTPTVVKYDRNTEIPFTFAGLYDGLDRTLTVTIKDSYGAASSGTYTYSNVYLNQPPNLDSSSTVVTASSICDGIEDASHVCQNTGGSLNAKVRLVISDDLDNSDHIKFCLSESSDARTCTNYRNYKDAFKNSDYISYTFTSTNATNPYNGEVKDLYVFMTDSYYESDKNIKTGQPSVSKLSYRLYKNTAPYIKNFKVAPDPTEKEKNAPAPESGSSPAEGSLAVLVTAEIIDDLTNASNLSYSISVDDGAPVLTGNGISSLKSGVSIPAATVYDGKDKKITLKITDSYGAYSESYDSHTIYRNESPVFNYHDVISESSACSDVETCPLSEGGSTKIKAFLDVTDDIDGASDLSVCISQDSSYCENKAENNSHFKTYSDTLSYTITPADAAHPYQGVDGSNENFSIKIAVKDKHGGYTVVANDYTLYRQQAPFINDEKTSVVSQSNAGNTKNVKMIVEAKDDFTAPSNMKMQICYSKVLSDEEIDESDSELGDGEVVGDEIIYEGDPIGEPVEYSGVLKQPPTCLAEAPYQTETNLTITDSDINPDDTVIFYYYVKDDSGSGEVSTSYPVSYALYDYDGPTIGEDTNAVKFDVDSTTKRAVSFSVFDMLYDYKVCINDTGTCSDANFGSTIYSGTDMEEHVLEVNSNSDTLILTVKNTNGMIKQKTLTVQNYTLCSERGPDVEYVDTLKSGETELTSQTCSGRCYSWNKDSLQSSTHNIKSLYTRTFSFSDRYYPSKKCSVPEDYEANCSYHTCFRNLKNNTYVSTVIGIVKHASSSLVILNGSNGKKYSSSNYYQVYTSSYNSGDYDVTLNPTPNIIPASDGILSELYSYNASAATADQIYLRALDGPVPNEEPDPLP